MNILVNRHGGLGDELCMTPSYRVMKSSDTSIYVVGAHPDILLDNPNISGAYGDISEVNINIDKTYNLQWFSGLKTGYDMHLVDFYAMQLGIIADSHELDYYIRDSELQSISWIKNLRRPIVCYNNDGGWRSREPRIELVAARLLDRCAVIQVGNGKPYCGIGYNLTHKISLRLLAALLHESDLYIGADSGIFHLASAVGCKSVIWFTSVDPKYRVHNINDIGLYNTRCHGCYSRDTEDILIGGECPKGNMECINIDVDMMLDNIHDVMGR